MPTLHATAGRLCRRQDQMNAVGLTNQSSPGNRDSCALLHSKKRTVAVIKQKLFRTGSKSAKNIYKLSAQETHFIVYYTYLCRNVSKHYVRECAKDKKRSGSFLHHRNHRYSHLIWYILCHAVSRFQCRPLFHHGLYREFRLQLFPNQLLHVQDESRF